jgi:hypothetical protein
VRSKDGTFGGAKTHAPGGGPLLEVIEVTLECVLIFCGYILTVYMTIIHEESYRSVWAHLEC